MNVPPSSQPIRERSAYALLVEGANENTIQVTAAGTVFSDLRNP